MYDLREKITDQLAQIHKPDRNADKMIKMLAGVGAGQGADYMPQIVYGVQVLLHKQAQIAATALVVEAEKGTQLHVANLLAVAALDMPGAEPAVSAALRQAAYAEAVQLLGLAGDGEDEDDEAAGNE